MILHLFNNGTGMITGGHARSCITVPSTRGTLVIGQRKIEIDGSSEIDGGIETGMHAASFVGEDGRRYEIGAVSLRQGRVCSLNAESEEVIKLLHTVDTLVESYSALCEKYDELKARLEYDAIDFITEGKTE